MAILAPPVILFQIILPCWDCCMPLHAAMRLEPPRGPADVLLLLLTRVCVP